MPATSPRPRLRLLLPPLLLTEPLATAPSRAPRRLRAEDGAFARHLLDDGVVGAHDLIRVMASAPARDGDLAGQLLAEGLARDPALTESRARFHGLTFIDPLAEAPDPRLIDRLGAASCLQLGLLPWREIAGVTIILADRPDALPRQREDMTALFGPVGFALASRSSIDAALHAARGNRLRQAAETRTPAAESCRSFSLPRPSRRLAFLVLALSALVAAPVGLLTVLTLWALLTLAFSAGLRLATLASALRPPTAAPAAVPVVARLPVVSVMVALYREADIAARLIRRLGRLDYPRDRLDVILIVEEQDRLTRNALSKAGLPPWMRVVVVPDAALRTKPRALNYALDFCRGSVVGVYDAEDAPDPGQIRAVVERFHQRGPQVACLQGVLDFYNPAANWLARCFTMEYATWFRVVLPGLDRMRLPLPLGGTTLFFRRAVLEELGGWDAHNVTEDADLGIRLYRHGYRTELVPTVTEEEANCHALPWIRQRSRWIKGYMMTWGVHMRDPGRLWLDLGPRGFLAFQILFLGSISQALIAPVLLSFWAVSLGLAHPVAGAMASPLFGAMVVLFLASAAIDLALGAIALARRSQRMSPLWLLTLWLYHPIATLAAYKAVWELLRCPFYWDKTGHGATALTAS